MTAIDLRDKVHQILRSHLPIENAKPLVPDARLVDLGLDSLRSVNLVLDLEDTFDIEFPDSMLTDATFGTVADLEQAIERLVTASTGAQQR
ncbi:phosphopantetheine-binding protein [Dactylosporangium sp. NPDC050688]|uniref:phosphopantetheine-binding protein n=1 Tax=Dactylosporangium sp. NPDC050688 TaxID=3157217 RepID=UPI0033E622FB